MKKICYILILLFVGCSESNDQSLDINEPQFLLERIGLNVDSPEFSGQHVKQFEYNSYNNPTFLYEYNTGYTPTSPSLIFNYDASQQLTDIVEPFEYYENNVLQNGYRKFSFSQFDDTIAVIDSHDYDSNNNSISNSPIYHFEVNLDGYLIKGYTLSGAGQTLNLSLQHDAQGRITELSFTGNSGSTNTDNSISISEWDDNIYPDNFGPIELQYMFDLLNYFFPKHYMSTKNPTVFTGSTAQYSFNSNGTVSDQIIECDGPACYTPKHYSKYYIPAN